MLFSERGGGLSPATVRLWFHRLSTSLQMDGCASHSGRRTFMTRAARNVSHVGGSLRDVQELADHTRRAMTPRDIEGDTEAKRTRVALLEARGVRGTVWRSAPWFRPLRHAPRLALGGG
jgi:integrase/recombinase XerC